ncbi:apolipophorins [Epargyreus clarus]|uniref:apolipophorins n=1 Tax=Epargyreus clarus TaxID=520877 RepID=UPI003C2E0AD7
MGGSRLSLSLFSVILILSVLWSPAYSDDKCSVACKGSSASPGFLNGHTYNYGVDGSVSVYLSGASGKESTVKIFGQVSVTALGNCAHVLNVKNLAIAGPDGKKYPCPKGIDKPVQFSLENGRVGAEICATDGDTRRSLNIKRAIISLLQTEQKTSTQIDFFGACPTEVSSSQEGGAVLIHKSRDLSRCAHREQGKNEFLTAVYNPTAEIKNTQILQSNMNVESKVNNGVPEKVTATEEYLYSPFSVGENGARAKVHTKLTLSGTAQGGGDAGNCGDSRTIIFENPHGNANEQSNFKNAFNAVKETAKTLTNEASSKSAGNFAQLVRIFRTTNKDDLMKIFNQIKGNELEKRVFLDGLLRTGTGYSIEASIQILKSKALNSIEEKLVFLSLGNARHVNDEAMKAAAGLLDVPKLPKEVYLGVGALAGVYCRDHDCHGAKSEGIVALSKKFGAKLQNCKPKTKAEEDYVVAVLKGIRNIRHLEDSLIDKISHCAADNTVKARVRVAALEAFHADPCAAKLKKTATDLMKNVQQDSEIRIKAYLAVIDCPCAHSANDIKNLLSHEPVHQVGRFITMSLRHIRSSANPDKQLAKQHYGLIGIPNKFNIDDRKYSSYREMSYNVDALGIGGNVEQTVIFSQDSFLPRSASLNLTAELFGHNINVLEIGGRQGNLDRVIEHFLGPKSFLRTQKPQDIYDDLVKRMEESSKKVETSVRGRRSIKSEVDNFDKQMKVKGISYNNELDLDVYLKIFGTDAVFLSLGDDKGFDANNILDQLLKLLNEGMNKIKRFQQEVRGHLLFLDAELAYPTSTGLPLKLDLIGAATARVDVATNINVKEILKSPENAKIDIKLVPSSDIEITGVFFVDADAIGAGLKVTNNLHSSTGGHLIAKIIENGHGFDLQYALPIDKQEILTASRDFVYFSAEKGCMEKTTPVVVDTDKKEYSGCFDQLAGVLGLTLCGEISMPFSVSGPDAQNSISKFMTRFPLSGAAKLKLVLEKNDLRGYHIKGIMRSDNNQGSYGVEMLFDAEGSQNRRTQIFGDVIMNAGEKTLKFSLDSPIKAASGQISLITKPSEYALMVKGKLDAQEYFARLGFNVQGDDRRSVFKPVAEYQLPDEHGKQSLKVDGQMIKETNGPVVKYTLEGIKINLPKSTDPITLDGHYSQEPKGIDLDVKAKQGQYSMIALFFNVKGYDFKTEFQNTLNPYVNFKANGHIENTPTVCHNDIDLMYGDFNNPQNKITFNQLYKYYKKSANEFNVITKNKFEIHAVPIKIKFDAEMDPKKFDIDVEGQYADRKADFEVEARTHIKKQGDYSVKIKGEIDKHGMEAFAKRDIVSAEKSNVENYIHFKNFGKYELSGVVLHKTKANDMNVGAVGHLKISGGGKNEDIKFDVGVIENNNLYSSHAKISSSKKEILDYLLKVTKGANPSGQLKFILTDTISANGQYKVTDNDGKGNGNIIIDFKTAGRKIKGDVKFVAKEPVFNADVDLFLNFEKDNNDKLHFTTNNKRTPKLIESKNKLNYAGKQSEVNIHQDGTLSASGKAHGSVEVCLPTGRILTLKVDRDMTVKDETYDGHAEVYLSDCPKRGDAGSSISYKTKVTNTDFDKNIDLDGQIEFKLKDGGNIVNTFTYKDIQKGDKSEASFDGQLKGSLIPKPMSLVASATYTELPHADDVYRVKASYGDDLFAELAGKFVMNLPEKGERKYLDDYTMTFRLPLEKAHDIKWISTLLYLQPENKDAEVTLIESVQINGDVYKVDASGKYGPKAGNTKVKILVPHNDPLVFDVNYQANLDGETKTGNVELKAQYGKGKTASVAAHATAAPQHTALKISANAPQAEKFKRLDVDFTSKKPSPDTVSTHLVVDADGRVYKSDSVVVYSKSQPLFDLKFTSPESPKQSRIYLKGTSMSSNQGKLEMKVENFRDFNMDVNTEGSIQKDNVAFKFNGNSEKLGLKNCAVDVSSKDAGSGKRLEFRAVNDNKNVLSGSTSFISKQEGPKTIIEGSGSVTLKNDQKPANFKYIRTVLTEGNEQGVETFVNLAIGERSYVAESRITNMEYKNSYVYCEEKKQCAHVDILSKINMQKPGVVQHLVNVGFDLRKLGFAPEFGLEVVNEFSEKKFPQYDLNLHINKEDKKYHLHMYSQPDFGKFPAGITVTLPQRVLALESIVQYPTGKSLPFPIRGEVCLYPDKNRPQQKTAARFNIDVTTSDVQGSAIAEFGFSHPKLGKEATVKLRGNVQRPDDKTLKIETSATFSHPTLGGDREPKFYLEVNPVHIKILLDTPIVKVMDIEGSAILKDNLQQGEINFSFLEGKPVTLKAVAKDFQYYEFTTGYSDDKERKLSIIGHIEPEKRLDISADIILPGHKKNIIHGALYLKDNLVKSDYGASKENFNYFVSALKNDVTTLETKIKGLAGKASEEFKKTMKRVEPTIKQMEQAYADDFKKLVNEVSNDQALKEISESLSHIVQFLAKMIDDIVTVTKPIVDKINAAIMDICHKTQELYEKQVEPQLKELYTNVSTMLKEYLDGLIDAATYYVALAIDFFEKHKPELQELANTFTEIFKDLTRILVAQLKEWRAKATAFFADLGAQIKELPIISFIKEKYQELSIPQQLLNMLKEVHNAVRGVLPTEEVRNFADALYKYTEKKINQEKMDEAAELRNVYEKLVAAVSSIVKFVRTQLNELGVPNVPMINSLPFIGPTSISSPSFGGSASFSLINQFIRGDIPSPLDLIKAYRPRSLNPLDEIPARLRAVVINGQHIFTFDGRHLTFPGNCRYVLVHDHVDRNFTLISQMQNGQPKSLILEDKSGTTIELKENGQVALNGANHGFPVIEDDVFAFKQPNGRIGLGSKYGLMVFCTSKLEVCYIDVNGFYLGKIRGLLGDGNNEPFDDFKLPNGKISTSESEFGNAYRMAGSCPQVKTPEHSHHQHHMAMPPACEAVFGGQSPLRPLSLVLDVAPFRQACIHAVSGEDEAAYRAACDLARGYAALAVSGLLPAALPARCVRCTDADSPKEVGDVYELKLPNKQADIVVTVEITQNNEKYYKEVVVPLVGTLVDTLKSKKINDIKIYLVGITSKFPYPIIYDTDLKLKHPKVKFDDKSRYDLFEPIKVHQETIDKYEEIVVDVINYFKVKLGLYNVMLTYQSVWELPLRPGAVKHFVASVGESCESQFFPMEAISAVLYEDIMENNAITHTLVTGLDGLTMGGKPVAGAHKTLAAKHGAIGIPHDACVEMTYKTDGYLISGPAFCALSPEQQKQQLQQAAATISSGMLRENLVQQCICMYVDPFRVRSECANKERKIAGRRRK